MRRGLRRDLNLGLDRGRNRTGGFSEDVECDRCGLRSRRGLSHDSGFSDYLETVVDAERIGRAHFRRDQVEHRIVMRLGCRCLIGDLNGLRDRRRTFRDKAFRNRAFRNSGVRRKRSPQAALPRLLRQLRLGRLNLGDGCRFRRSREGDDPCFLFGRRLCLDVTARLVFREFSQQHGKGGVDRRLRFRGRDLFARWPRSRPPANRGCRRCGRQRRSRAGAS